MTAPFSESKVKKIAAFIMVFLVGIIIGKFLFTSHKDENPTVVTFNGQSIGTKDLGLSDQERSGNSVEYAKQIAMNKIRAKVISDLAAKEKLSDVDFMQKIKSGANDKLSEDEVSEFLKERNFDRKKLSKAQLDNIIGNMKAHKREVFFNEFMNKQLETMNIKWNL